MEQPQPPVTETPIPPTPQDTSPQPPTPPVPPVVYQPAAPVRTGGNGLAIAAMVLGIISVVLAVIWFISAPLAITALVLGIVSLVKRRPGKGMSITGVVTSGVTLVLVLPFLFISVVVYQGLQQRALEAQEQYQQAEDAKPQNSAELFN